jgi:hypothetical protein
MSTPFANPWSNPHNPIDMLKRRNRKKAKKAEKAAADARVQGVEDNRNYETSTRETASAFQRNQSRKTWNDPFASATQTKSGLWTPYGSPSDRYDPTDW